MLLLLVSVLNVIVFSAVADFPTSCSGGPTADDIHDVPIVPSAAVPHADDNRIGPCRVQQQRGSRDHQYQQQRGGSRALDLFIE
jgi:hypothetical protein